MNVKVKICGIRSLEAAKVATLMGAEFLGFNFILTSKRYINPFDAAKIINAVKDKVKIVGVFQDSDINYVNKLSSSLGLDFVQLHGREDDDYIKQVKAPVIKAIQVHDKSDGGNVAYYLLDRSKRKGKMVNFQKASQLAEKIDFFFAGGLNPDNVADVIKKVKPFAVDVAGGVETNGEADIQKIKEFINIAKELK